MDRQAFMDQYAYQEECDWEQDEGNMVKEYLVIETYTDNGKCVVFYQDYDGQHFDEFKAGPTGDVYKSVVKGRTALNAYLNEFEAI